MMINELILDLLHRLTLGVGTLTLSATSYVEMLNRNLPNWKFSLAYDREGSAGIYMKKKDAKRNDKATLWKVSFSEQNAYYRTVTDIQFEDDVVVEDED